MSIFPPSDKPLTRTYNIAALDLPIPESLWDRKDQAEWSCYAKCLPIARAIEKFGAAMDQFLDLLPATKKKVEKLSLDEVLKVHAKWQAASIINAGVIGEKVGFALTPEQDEIAYKTDLGRGAFFVTEFLKGVQSPLAQEWEDRRARLSAQYCDRKDRNTLNSPTHVMLAIVHRHSLAMIDQRAQGGSQPTPPSP
jgi:hypothetical protein